MQDKQINAQEAFDQQAKPTFRSCYAHTPGTVWRTDGHSRI